MLSYIHVYMLFIYDVAMLCVHTHMCVYIEVLIEIYHYKSSFYFSFSIFDQLFTFVFVMELNIHSSISTLHYKFSS